MAGEELLHRLIAPVEPESVAGSVRIPFERDHPHRVDRGGHGGDLTLGEDRDFAGTKRVQRDHGAPPGGPESDNTGPQRSSVPAGDAGELKRVEYRAVAGQLVVLVEDVEVEGAVGVPVVHRLPGDDRRPGVDRRLGQRLVLDAMGPAPEDLSFMHFRDIGGQRLRLEQHVAFSDELLPGAVAADQRGQVRVAEAEAAAVAVLEVNVLAQGSIDVAEVARMERQPSLVLLARAGEDSE